jgi:hypothetical protein
MTRETISGLIILAAVFFVGYVMIQVNTEDKYVMRDGCVYHKTTELSGDDFETNYTLVTCDSTKFHKYTIEK